MRPAVEIYKLLPRTNCGTCGTSSCFGFAAKLATGQARADDCPSMSSAARDMLRTEESKTRVPSGTVFEQTLKAIRQKMTELDFARVAKSFGARLQGPERLEIVFLNETYTVTKEGVVDSRGGMPRPFLSILICNHLCMPDPPSPSGEWITFSSVPASHAKDKAWAGHVEDVIAKRFTGKVAELGAACRRFGGVLAEIR